MTRQKQSERAEAIARLLETLKPGDTVYTQMKHCSRSGMQRVIQLLVIEDNQPRWIGYTAAKAMDMRYDKDREGIVIGGCGMDMGFALVYDLARTLFKDGFGVELTYPNGSTGRGKTREMATKAIEAGAKCRGRNGDGSGWDNDGGYALNHRWL